MCAVAAQTALEVLPVDERDFVCCDAGPVEMVAAYQYPRQLTGRPCVCSHQVVIRGADLHATDTAAQREQAWLECVSDLHKDSMDGRMGPLGCMTQYICTRHPDAQTGDTCQSFSYRDLVVYPNACGGRGVRIRVARPGWTCLVFMRTGDRKARQNDRTIRVHAQAHHSKHTVQAQISEHVRALSNEMSILVHVDLGVHPMSGDGGTVAFSSNRCALVTL